MKKIKETLGLLLLIISVLSIFYAPVYWLFNDHLTKMQVFKELWFLIPVPMILAWFGIRLLDS